MLVAVIEHDRQQSRCPFRAVNPDIRKASDQSRHPSYVVRMRVCQNECVEAIQMFDFWMKIVARPGLDTAIDHDSVPAYFEKVAASSHFRCTAERDETSVYLGADLDWRRLSILRISIEKSTFEFPKESPLLI